MGNKKKQKKPLTMNEALEIFYKKGVITWVIQKS